MLEIVYNGLVQYVYLDNRKLGNITYSMDDAMWEFEHCRASGPHHEDVSRDDLLAWLMVRFVRGSDHA